MTQIIINRIVGISLQVSSSLVFEVVYTHISRYLSHRVYIKFSLFAFVYGDSGILTYYHIAYTVKLT